MPFATPFGAVRGSIHGLGAAVIVAFWDQTGAPGLSFQYILAASLAVDIAVGCCLSLVPFSGRSRPARVGLTAAALAPLAAAIGLFAGACMS